MRRLILLRHAKTERDSPTGSDFDRRLDARGQKDAHEIGTYLSDSGLAPDLALVSPAIRARETWSLVAPALKSTDVALESGLYGAEISELLRIITAANGRSSDPKLKALMIIAHNPGLHELALTLSNATGSQHRKELESNFPTCGVAVIDFAVHEWDEVTPRSGSLERFISPRQLRLQRET